jgi:hypothetical protein
MANQNKVGLVFGTLVGGLHLVWSILVLLNLAQPLVDFSLWAHMVHVPATIGPFEPTAAATVVIVAACVGYAVGYIGATIWNRIHK